MSPLKFVRSKLITPPVNCCVYKYLHDITRHFPKLSQISLFVVDEDVAGNVRRLVPGHDVHQRALAWKKIGRLVNEK